MSCNSVTLASIDARCDGSVGGIKRILLANKDDVTVTIATEGNDNQLVSDIKLASGKKFEEWKFRKGTGSYTSTFETDASIGNTTVTTEVALQFSRAEATKRLAIQSALLSGCVVIVEDAYSNYLLLGNENEVTVTSAVMQSGTATSDLSGFTLTFTDIATELPHFIDTDSVDVDALLVASV